MKTLLGVAAMAALLCGCGGMEGDDVDTTGAPGHAQQQLSRADSPALHEVVVAPAPTGPQAPMGALGELQPQAMFLSDYCLKHLQTPSCAR